PHRDHTVHRITTPSVQERTLRRRHDQYLHAEDGRLGSDAPAEGRRAHAAYSDPHFDGSRAEGGRERGPRRWRRSLLYEAVPPGVARGADSATPTAEAPAPSMILPTPSAV